MVVNPLHGLGVGVGIANDAEARLLAASERGRQMELDALRQRSRPGETNDRLLQERDDALKSNAILRQTLAARDSLLLEWMHSNETLKQLARQYGQKLGLSDSERQRDFDSKVLEVAKEDPRFSGTKLAQKP